MKQFLKNYTSDVPVHQTIGKIEQVLIRCGVTGITKEYSPEARVEAVTFHIKISEDKPLTIRLPVNSKMALEALWLDYVGTDQLSANGTELHWSSKKRKKKSEFADQAERTAWKIIQDWVEVQMSLIQLGQAEVREVFLPYFWDGKKSFFQTIKDSGFKQLAEKND